jgi:hypothetical protein
LAVICSDWKEAEGYLRDMERARMVLGKAAIY